MSDSTVGSTRKDGASQDFPEVEISVAPVAERSRATFAKTHNRAAVANFSHIFGDEKK
ncbi:MAG: hypothetical protein ACRDXX_16570 [Stackebrandtia sp.]